MSRIEPVISGVAEIQPGSPVCGRSVWRAQEPGMMWYSVVQWEISHMNNYQRCHGPCQYCGRERENLDAEVLGSSSIS